MIEITALIPAYNEAAIIGRTVTALARVPEVKEIVVVDDGSQDQTAREAVLAGARVLRLGQNRGKAEAVLAGSRLARFPYLALLDADLGESASEIARLIASLPAGKKAMAVALFPPSRQKGGLGLVKKMAAWAVYCSTGIAMREPLSGQRVLHRDLLGLLCSRPRGFGREMAVILDLPRRGVAGIEVETEMRHRERGKDAASILHRARQGRAVLQELWIRRSLFMRGCRA